MKFDTEALDQAVNEIVSKISAAIPEDLKSAKQGLEKNARATVEGVFQRLDLVTREEFDIQAELLSNTRALVDELEKKVAELEAANNEN